MITAPQTIDNIVLYDENIEQQLLGCILIENKVLQKIEIDLNEDSFYFEIHKLIYNTIKDLLQNNQQADEQTMYYALLEKPDASYKDQDLKKYLSTLISYGAVAFSTPKEMTRILNFLALKRRLAIYSKEINNTLQQSAIGNIDEQIGQLEKQMYEITNLRRQQDDYSHLSKYTKVLADKLQKARKSDKTILGVRTGLVDIDNYTGGLQKSDLIIIAARPSMGKTALATTIAKNVAEILQKEVGTSNNNPDTAMPPQAIAMFSLEMSGEQLASRIVAMDSGFNTKTIHTGRYDDKDITTGEIITANKKISDSEWNQIYKSMQDVGRLPLYIDDTPALNISVLRSRARYMKNKYNICAIIIDYLQLLRPSKSLGGNRVLEIAEITSTLKAIAKELDIPVIALSQLSRAVEGSDRKDKRPQLSDLRESGTIEQDADIVMLLYREEYYLSRQEPKITDETDSVQLDAHKRWMDKYDKIKNLADVIVAKNRNGPVGTITLSFDREHMLFSGYDPHRDPYNYTGHHSVLPSTNQQYPYIAANNHDAIPDVTSNSTVAVNHDTYVGINNDTDGIPDDLKDIFE